jgi:dihydroorotate dehydrogenase
MNAAGTLGYAPPAEWPLAQPLGAFVTNPVSRRPRTPAALRGCVSYPGGLLLHSGLPNPGFHAVLRAHARRWSQAGRPIWVHLIPASPAETLEMVQELEQIEGIGAVEIGLEPEGDGSAALELLAAGAGELPVVAALSLSAAGQPWLTKLNVAGVSGITLSAPRGKLPGLSGRLYGPALFPQMYEALQTLRPLGLPLIAGCGIYTQADAQACLAGGAAAVQVDLALWKGVFPEKSLYISR